MSYTRDQVEHLLHTVWDPDAVYGVPVQHAPPQDMPRGSVNKSHGNTLYAHIADMKTGWKKAELNQRERQSVLLRYAYDLTEAEIGRVLGRPQQTVSYQLYTGVGKIVAELNGEVFTEAEV